MLDNGVYDQLEVLNMS